MTECRQIEPLLAERASGDVAPEAADRIDGHLADCPRCRAELAAYEETFAVARSPAAAPPDGLASETLAAWKRGRRRRSAALAVGSGLLALAASVALVIAPSHSTRRQVAPEGQPQVTAWSGDVDGGAQDEDLSIEELALAAFDAASGHP